MLKFKVGDKVKILSFIEGDPAQPLSPFSLGDIATILEYDNNDPRYTYRLDTEGGAGWWFSRSNLELVTEEETSYEPKVGDKVKILSFIEEESRRQFCPFSFGDIATISDYDEDDSVGTYRLATSTNAGWWFSRSNLELVTEAEEEAKEETPHVYKVGDKVTILRSYMTSFEDGDEGVITDIDDDESDALPYKVENQHTYNWFNDIEIELADPTSVPEWFLQSAPGVPITVEDSEDTPPTDLKFKEGDKVTILKSRATCFFDGEQGIIAEVVPDRPWPYTVVNGGNNNVFGDDEIEPYVEEEVIQETKPLDVFPQEDLKTGMIVRGYDDKLCMVLLGTENGDIVTGGSWGLLSSHKGDITEVYQPQNNMGYLPGGEISLEQCELLWKKPEPVEPAEVVEEVTEAQVCILLGRKVKVVG